MKLHPKASAKLSSCDITAFFIEQFQEPCDKAQMAAIARVTDPLVHKWAAKEASPTSATMVKLAYAFDRMDDGVGREYLSLMFGRVIGRQTGLKPVPVSEAFVSALGSGEQRQLYSKRREWRDRQAIKNKVGQRVYWRWRKEKLKPVYAKTLREIYWTIAEVNQVKADMFLALAIGREVGSVSNKPVSQENDQRKVA